jgi:hypothetical protein
MITPAVSIKIAHCGQSICETVSQQAGRTVQMSVSSSSAMLQPMVLQSTAEWVELSLSTWQASIRFYMNSVRHNQHLHARYAGNSLRKDVMQHQTKLEELQIYACSNIIAARAYVVCADCCCKQDQGSCDLQGRLHRGQ